MCAVRMLAMSVAAVIVLAAGAAGATPSGNRLPSSRIAVDERSLCDPVVQEVPVPTVPRVHLNRIASAPDGTIWAVGYTDDADMRGVVLRLMRGRFVAVPVPRGVEELRDVVAPARNRAWAVGMNGVFRWDGRRWERAPALAASYWGISAAGPNDVWAVGPSVIHWDGTTWTTVPFTRPRGPGGGTVLMFAFTEAVLALGKDDVWVAGDGGGSSGFTAHWDGRTWTTHPVRVEGSDLGSLDRDASGHIWVSGGLRGGRVIAERTDSTWRVRGRSFWIHDVVARDAEVWALFTSIADTVAARWNGKDWTALEKPHPDLELTGLAVDPRGDVWASGWFLSQATRHGAVVYRYRCSAS